MKIELENSKIIKNKMVEKLDPAIDSKLELEKLMTYSLAVSGIITNLSLNLINTPNRTDKFE